MNILASIFKKIIRLPKKILIPGMIILLASIYFFFLRGPQGPKLEFAQVKKQDIASTVSASGETAGKDTVNLKFPQGGKLVFNNIKAGDRVTTGQIIAGLNTQSLGFALQQAQNNLRDKQATLDKILDDIHLFQYGNGGFGNVGSPSETQTQRELRTSAEVAVNNAQEAVRIAQRNFQDTSLEVPFDGVVTQVNTFAGQFVGPADIVAQVVNDSKIFFDAEIDEGDLSKVNLGQKADISLDAYPDKTFTGTITEILPQTQTTSTNATIVLARISFTPPANFVFGLNGQVSIITSQAKNVLTVPQEALRSDNTVAVQTPTGFENIKVEPGIRSDSDVEIIKGLSEGQTVILNPPNILPQKQQNILSRILKLGGR